MRKTLASLGLVSMLIILPILSAAASAQVAVAKSDALKGATKACNLLRSQDIQSVQGEALQKATGRESAQGDLAESQCSFALPTGSKSMRINSHLQERPVSAGPLPLTVRFVQFGRFEGFPPPALKATPDWLHRQPR